MASTPLLRATATLAGAVTVVSLAATPTLAAAKKPATQAPRITSGPADGSYVASRSATFAFSGPSSNVTFTCQLDSGTVGTCKSPKTYSGLADGSQHTFRVRAQAPSKSPSTWVARTWHVDLHVPAPPTITSSPPSLSNTSKGTFAFGSETGATLLCSLDGGGPASCSSPYTTRALADGGHVLAVKQVARNGLTSAATSFAWTIDTTAPAAPVINSGPAAGSTVRPADVVFGFSDTDDTVASYACAVTTGSATPTFTDCTPATFSSTSLADGTYTFHVVAKDAAGNTSSEATRTFTVSSAAPAPPVVSGQPAPVTNVRTATFTVPAGSTCTLDGGSPTACSGTYTTPTLSDGQHTFQVANGGATTSYTWTVDTSPPAAPTFVNAPAAGSSVNTTSLVVGIDSDGSSQLTCTLDGAAKSCPGFLSTTVTDGSHTLVAVATDAAGNKAQTTLSWRVDTVAPKPAIAAPASLTGPVVVAFGEQVTAVRNATLAALTLTNGGASVPATTTCWKGSTSVACSSQSFDTVRLKSNAALIPGQHYTAAVGAGVVQDLAGNNNLAASKAFRGQRLLQENAPGSKSTWQTVMTSSAAGGSFVREHLAGAAAAWSFTGTAVTLRTVTGPIYGKADLYIDGVRKKTINTYAASRHFNVGRTVSGLPNASHRLRVVVLGVKGAKAGKGTYVAIDGFTVGTTKTDSPVLATNWRRFANSHLSGGHAIITDLSGEVVTFTFRGTGLTWFTVKGVAQGRARVFIDGVRKATYDDYATSTSYGVKHAVTGLSNALHTVRLLVLGTHHKGAKGSLVTVDRFLVA